MSNEVLKEIKIKEESAYAYACKIAVSIGGVVCGIVTLLGILFAELSSVCAMAVFFSMIGTLFVVKFKKLRNESDIIVGIVMLALAVVFFVMFVLNLVK